MVYSGYRDRRKAGNTLETKFSTKNCIPLSVSVYLYVTKSHLRENHEAE